MKLAVFGLWHLGSVTAACTAAAGIRTAGIDLDRDRIAKLAAGEPPLYEPGLADLVRSSIAAGTLSFSSEVESVSGADIIWVCDLVKEAGVHIHDQVEGSVLIDGDLLYVNSCNGVISRGGEDHEVGARRWAKSLATSMMVV